MLLSVTGLLTAACGSDDDPDNAGTDGTTPTSVDGTSSTTTPPTTSGASIGTVPNGTSDPNAPTTTGEGDSIGTVPGPDLDDLEPTLSANSSVSTVGLDEVQFGMSLTAAQEAAGTAFTPLTPVGDCYLVEPDEAPDGITFWVTAGTIERVDITEPFVTTRSGFGVGNTEQEILDWQPDQIEITPLADGSGNLLTFVPVDEADAQFRVVFQTNGAQVVKFWSGRLPIVNELDGCPA